MRVTIACIHYPVASGRYVADAFRRLGHEVKTIGFSTGNQIWGITVDNKYIWKPENPVDPNWPDLVIVMDSDTSVWDEVAAIKFPCPVIVYGVDNHVRSYESNLFQHKFLAHYHGQAYPIDPTRKDMTWLPCGANTTIFTPSQIEWSKREYDIALVGVLYPQRVQAIEALREAGFKVFAATGLVYDEYRAAYHNSRAALCISINGDLAQRFFEGAMLGCLVITDLLRDLQDEVTNEKLGLQGYASTGFTVDNPNNINALILQCKTLLHGEGDPMYIEQAKASAATLQAIVRDFHTWDARCQVVVDWFTKEYGVVASITDTVWKNNAATYSKIDLNQASLPTTGKAYLNLGCGRTHLPSAKPAGHEAVDDDVYAYPLWVNVDKVDGVGADKTFDLFTYPWPIPDNSFDGALLAHIVEHIGHEIKPNNSFWEDQILQETDHNMGQLFAGQAKPTIDRWFELQKLQDGWYAFWSELYRVLTPGALVHVVSPYGFSDGGITDPSHTRYLTLNTFTHSMSADVSDGSTFKYNNGDINFVIEGAPMYRVNQLFAHIKDAEELQYAMQTRLNVVYDFYLKLKVVK